MTDRKKERKRERKKERQKEKHYLSVLFLMAKAMDSLATSLR